MPVLNLNIPAVIVPDLQAMCREKFPIVNGVDPLLGMTPAQSAQKYTVEVLKSAVTGFRQNSAVVSTRATVDAAVNQAITDVSGIA